MTSREEQAIRALEAIGIKGVKESDWTPELALSVLRENRRRYAHEPSMQAIGALGTKLADALAGTGINPADIALVLLASSARLCGLSFAAPDLTIGAAADIMQCAADDLDRQAKAGEQQ